MYKDKEVTNVKNFFVNVWRKNIFDIYVTEYGTASSSSRIRVGLCSYWMCVTRAHKQLDRVPLQKR